MYRFDGLEQYRKGMKRLLNARLFDKGDRKSKPKRTPKEIREGVELYPSDMSIAELLAILNVAHAPIAKYFGSGIGHSLQFVESQIITRILMKLQHAGVVGLPVHDCIVVARSSVEVAKRIMAGVVEAEAGASIPVTVEGVDDC